MYQDTQLLIGNAWADGANKETIDVLNPATGDVIGRVAKATIADLDSAIALTVAAFPKWRRMSAFERSNLLKAAAANVRANAEKIATLLTLEQGKPIAEARMETLGCADVLEWSAEEARRIYGRLVPSRRHGVTQKVMRQPVGPVAAFTPWNFPASQVIKKVAPALAAGCTIIVKAPEETPASAAELIKAIVAAGLPSGVLQLVYGDPAEISSHLIAHPGIRKISFTGSVPVGKMLASLAGKYMKRTTMELGGHAPAIIFDDVDVNGVADMMVGSKFRNAGQVCVSPTRFMIQRRIYDQFVDRFTEGAKRIVVGDGLDPTNQMGPLVNRRRVDAVDDLIMDARKHGANIRTGGERIGNVGCFYKPTVLADVDPSMRIMNEEPFGPVALMRPFEDLEEVVTEANRLPFGLASYAFSRSAKNIEVLGEEVEAGMMTINHLGLALPEVPFGGLKDSGYGYEGGSESVDAFLVTKLVTSDALA